MNYLGLTIVAVVIYALSFAATVGIGQSAGQKGGVLLGLILLAATIGALRSIWKSGMTTNGSASSNSTAHQL